MKVKEKTFFQHIKNYYNKLDKQYDIHSISLKSTISIVSTMLVLLIFSIYLQPTSEGITALLSSYLSIISIITLLMVLILNLYDRPPKKIKALKRTKSALKIINMVIIAFFYLSVSPVTIPTAILNYIALIFHIKFLVKILDITFVNVSVYFLAYMACVYYYITKKDTLIYIFIVSFACLLIHSLRRILYMFSYFSSCRDKYEFLLYSKKALTHIINILTVFSSIVSLYISKDFIIYVIPIIIFNGFEQLSLIYFQHSIEKLNFVGYLYNELIKLQDISYTQIVDFSCIKIRIKLSVTPYTIENYIKYFQTENSKDKFLKLKIRKRIINEKLTDTLKNCKAMLLKEYAVYQDMDKTIFEKDLTNSIENLAYCLNNIL